jgi:hypothetical protein
MPVDSGRVVGKIDDKPVVTKPTIDRVIRPAYVNRVIAGVGVNDIVFGGVIDDVRAVCPIDVRYCDLPRMPEAPVLSGLFGAVVARYAAKLVSARSARHSDYPPRRAAPRGLESTERMTIEMSKQ